MRRSHRLAAGLAGLPLAALVAACSASGSRPDVVRSTVLDQHGNVIQTSNIVAHRVDSLPETGDAAIRRVATGYTRIGLTPNVVDATSGMVGVRSVNLSRRLVGIPLSTYLDCGVDAMSGVPLADRDRVELTLLTEVKASPTGSTLRTSLGGRAMRAATGASMDPKSCSSRGTLETKLAQAIKSP